MASINSLVRQHLALNSKGLRLEMALHLVETVSAPCPEFKGIETETSTTQFVIRVGQHLALNSKGLRRVVFNLCPKINRQHLALNSKGLRHCLPNNGVMTRVSTLP